VFVIICSPLRIKTFPPANCCFVSIVTSDTQKIIACCQCISSTRGSTKQVEEPTSLDAKRHNLFSLVLLTVAVVVQVSIAFEKIADDETLMDALRWLTVLWAVGWYIIAALLYLRSTSELP
jgi:hypothetical protein